MQYEWYTDWVPAIGLDKMKGVLKNSALTGNFESRLALQTASIRMDNPDSPTLLESSYQGSGERCSTTLTISSYTGAKQLVRFGVAYHLSTGSTPGQSDTQAEYSWDACGRIVGSRSVQLIAPDTSSYYMPLTDWIPAIHADKAKAAIVATNTSMYFRTQLAIRTATTSREWTNAWSSNLEGNWHTGDGEFNTGEVSLSTGSDMWVQLGVEYGVSSGTNGVGHLDVSIGVRRT